MKNDFALLLILGLFGCKKLTDIEAAGKVRDAASQQPLDSVRVMLYEDNDGPFMGNHLLQEALTDGNGNFKFTFTYKEGPYKIFLEKPGYTFTRTETDKILNRTHTFNYQEVAALEPEQYFVLDMKLQSNLMLKVKNVAPAKSSDVLQIKVGKPENGIYPFTRDYNGLTEVELLAGTFDANQYVPVLYSVQQDNIWQHVTDSIYIQPRTTATYNLNY